jgi:hypothetical protein
MCFLGRAAIVFAAWSLGGQCFGQNYNVRGRIIDESTKNGVADVHVSSNAQYTITDSTGYFSLAVKKIPCVVRISHVAYGTFEYPVNEIPKSLLIISINPEITAIDEIQVSGQRLMVLTRRDPYSIQEFEVGRQSIWFIGAINNRADQNRLFLANLLADTISSLPLRGAVSLFRDVFDNVHLVTKDSVYQLFASANGQIKLLYPYARADFFKTMEGCELALGEKLVYAKNSPDHSKTEVFYIQENDPVKHLLTMMENTSLNAQRRTAAKMDSYMSRWGVRELIDMWSTIYRYSKRGTNFDRVINPPVPYSLFKTDSNLFVVNYLKDSLLKYSLEGEYLGAMTIGFHKEEFYTDDRFRKLEFITDPVSHRIYMLENQLGHWILEQLDADQGKPIRIISLPEFPGMDQIHIYDNSVYFLYPEKTFPYYSRLYRLAI